MSVIEKEYLTTESQRLYKKRYYQKNRERLLEYRKKYYADHMEQEKARQKRYSMTHDRSEYDRERYKARKEKEKSERDICVLSERPE